MGDPGSGVAGGKRQNVIQRAQCQFCLPDEPPVTAKHYRKHRVHLKSHAYSRGPKEPINPGSEYGCRHCQVVTYSPGTAMDHLIASHPDFLGPVRGWTRVTQHMPPEPTAVAPEVSDETTRAFVAELAEANQALRLGMADLVDLVAKLEAELKEATTKRPAKLEGLAARLFAGWTERGADAFHDK